MDDDRLLRFALPTRADRPVDFIYDGPGNRMARTVPLPPEPELTEKERREQRGMDNMLRVMEVLTGTPKYEEPSEAPEVVRYRYDGSHQLIAIEHADGGRTEYEYDALGRRVAKHHTAVGGELLTTLFMWDGDWMTQEVRTGRTAHEDSAVTYVRHPDHEGPLTRLADGQVWHYVTDHLGTPQEMYDQDGEIVWAADFSAYGLTARSLAQEVDNPIRFPGQYHDQETGLHYNRFRYYDPQVGRYISQDPIGLKGGANLYSYVHGNPVLRIDPLGLDDTMCMYNPSMCGMAPVPSESNVSVGLGAWGNLLGSYGSGEVGADVDSTGTMCIHVQSCVGAIVGLPLQGQIGITAGTGTGTLCTGTQTTYGGFVVGGAGVGGGGQVTGNSGGMALSRGMVGVGASPEGVVAGAGGLMCRTRYWCTK